MRRRKVIIIEDEQHYRDGLLEFLQREADVEAYVSPDAFAEEYTEPGDLAGTYLVIMDFRFDTYNAFDKDLISYIREDLNYRGKVVLWSLEDQVPGEFAKRLDAIIPKKIFSLSEIAQCLE